jgi:hypothetical protein
MSRFAIAGSGLRKPLAHPIEINGWYYFGASSDPKVIKITNISGDMVFYRDRYEYTNQTGRELRAERWVMEDLIATATATVEKQILDWQRYIPTYDWYQTLIDNTRHIIDRADLTEDDKQYIDQQWAELEVVTTPEAQERRRLREYQIEDVTRSRVSDSYLEAVLANADQHHTGFYVVRSSWYDDFITYPLDRRDNDYWWEDDPNVYPFDTVVQDIPATPLTKLWYEFERRLPGLYEANEALKGYLNQPYARDLINDLLKQVNHLQGALMAIRWLDDRQPTTNFYQELNDLETQIHDYEVKPVDPRIKIIEKIRKSIQDRVNWAQETITRIDQGVLSGTDAITALDDHIESVLGARMIATAIIYINPEEDTSGDQFLAKHCLDALQQYRTRIANGSPDMIANVYHNGKHSRLSVKVADLEDLIMRCGWTVVDQIENLTDAARQEVKRLEERGYVESSGGGIEWWKARLISEEDSLTPDM